MKRIDFDIETAKKIQNGEIEGRIETRDGHSVRVLCWDRKDEDDPIIALVKYNDKECLNTYGISGRYHKNKEYSSDLVLYVKEHKSPLLDRLKAERDDLIGKIDRLAKFLTDDEKTEEYDPEYIALMNVQQSIMISYSTVLLLRIQRVEKALQEKNADNKSEE